MALILLIVFTVSFAGLTSVLFITHPGRYPLRTKWIFISLMVASPLLLTLLDLFSYGIFGHFIFLFFHVPLSAALLTTSLSIRTSGRKTLLDRKSTRLTLIFLLVFPCVAHALISTSYPFLGTPHPFLGAALFITVGTSLLGFLLAAGFITWGGGIDYSGRPHWHKREPGGVSKQIDRAETHLRHLDELIEARRQQGSGHP